MKADTLIRWSTMAAVAAMAIVAGWVSYTHAYDVVREYGQTGAVAYAYPVTTDGMIYSASMVLLNAARQKRKPHGLAWFTVGLGIAVTGATNAWAGWPHGPIAAVIYAWPALALVLGYELLMLLIRSGAYTEALSPAALAGSIASVRSGFGGVSVSATPEALREQDTETLTMLRNIFLDEILKRETPGKREIMRRLKVGFPVATKYHDLLKKHIDELPEAEAAA